MPDSEIYIVTLQWFCIAEMPLKTFALERSIRINITPLLFFPGGVRHLIQVVVYSSITPQINIETNTL